MNTQHTPGEWVVNEIGGKFIVTSEQVEVDICEVFNPYPLPGEYDGKTDAEAALIRSQRKQANANLIAAAPDLLEACQFALKFCEQVRKETGGAQAGSNCWALNHAIAKATGQAVAA